MPTSSSPLRPSRLTSLRSLWRHRRLALAVFGTVVSIRFGLYADDFVDLRNRLLAETRVTRARDDRTARRLLKAVRISARLVPGASCLTQALAGQVLLARHGLASDILLGVRKDQAGAFKAHAWLYYDGKVALGGAPAAASGFSELASFRSQPS
jgi:hypothetical protein